MTILTLTQYLASGDTAKPQVGIPFAIVGGPYTGLVNVAITFDGTGSVDLFLTSGTLVTAPPEL
jgi:hypothetical protein